MGNRHEPVYIVDYGCEIGEGTKIWHFSHIQAGARIGCDCTIGQNVNIGPSVVIGNDVKIQNNVSVYEGVTIEDRCFIGPSVVFTNVTSPRAFTKGQFKSTLVRTGASIGANATIVCGNTIGRYSLIGAGSVVTIDVPDYAVCYGVPAEKRGWICECGNKIKGHWFCTQCGKRYEREGAGLKREDMV